MRVFTLGNDNKLDFNDVIVYGHCTYYDNVVKLEIVSL